MTCFNCGKEVKDLNSKFCSNCGAPIEEPDEELEKKEASKPESKRQKIILLICAVAIVLAVIAVVITGINAVSQKKAAAEIEEKVMQEKKKVEEAEAAKKKIEDEEKAKAEADEAAKKAAEEEAKKKAEADAQAAAEAQAARTWTDEKTLKLRGFMSSWGQTMGQQYQEYWPGKSVNFYGVRVPDDITGVRPQGMIVAVDGAPIVLQWSQSGEEQGVYHLVAVYSDIDSGEIKPGGGHCYLFCIYNGRPVALHTSQNQGNPENYFHFAPTENADLSNGFADILQGRR
ncbi:putative nucleic acid-binding Zn ribbon protein [Lachnospiraceae bacterium PM6-15]|uniref:Zinc ribbon domain-containing protein n=1 Tax=Ohessyouella blattaphilus TaxID=2949333 RepID=A0ABT1EHS4_9FIRM|nr:zinc ribbon domain-containing protein [Ohessyouella blattaphilus]MCP1108842.1 zinc ribbon domain-containing protein [Ohessyouella blattaphilus]MCR8562236.1 zinc ribbon domain-containing protein [Ohessyouella blattaphilus]MDL2249107.1 zinc ribbon domain-containing protein [Lachnospiraceae bacterium OttesenSCG-928-J05]